MIITTLQEADDVLDKLLSFLSAEEPMPCTNRKGGKVCTQQHDTTDGEGRSRFWYGVDCDVPRKHFCRACLAYWLVAVARNVLLEEHRFAVAIKKEG